MNLRRAEPGDAGSIADVYVRSWREAYRGLMPQEYLDSLDTEPRRLGWERIRSATQWPGAGAFVVEADDDAVAGFAHVGPARDADASEAVGEVTAIYVLKAYSGLGAGRALMEAAVATLRDADFSEATLWVLADHGRARRFYDRAGWAVDDADRAGDRRGFPLREVRYRRRLAHDDDPGTTGRSSRRPRGPAPG